MYKKVSIPKEEMNSPDFVKVELNDSRKKNISFKDIEPVGAGIKVIRQKERPVTPDDSSVSSLSSDSGSDSEPEFVAKKKKKKIIRKKVNNYSQDYSSFSNPQKIKHKNA